MITARLRLMRAETVGRPEARPQGQRSPAVKYSAWGKYWNSWLPAKGRQSGIPPNYGHSCPCLYYVQYRGGASSMERRLAAVMIADVVGYGRLSQADEEGTRARFQVDLNDVFRPQIVSHHGRIVKTMGDALLVEFHSVVDALRCAVEIQQTLKSRNVSVPPERRLEFRIGINLGDVIVEGDDIHGDGVNIAHRMQSLAEASGIAISGTTYDHVKAKLPVGYASLGQQRVKSIQEPIQVYQVLLDPASAGKTVHPSTSSTQGRTRVLIYAFAAIAVVAASTIGWYIWAQIGYGGHAQFPAVPDKPSLVVLPFDNLSDDANQSYLADGITEDLTTELARVPGLFVVSRNAAFSFKGQSIPPSQIASKLGVRYVLEGSVRRAGNELRINAQLIDATSNGHVWAEKFDGAWKDVFELQDTIVGKIASALELRLIQGQSMASSGGGTKNAAAYDLFLLGLDAARQGTPKDIAIAAQHYERAISLDPNFGRAAAELAWLYWSASGNKAWLNALGVSDEEASDKINLMLQLSAVNPSTSYYQINASRLVHDQRSSEAIAMLEKAISLDASDAVSYELMSEALTFSGRPAEGRGFIDAAMRMDPGWSASRHYLTGLAYFSMGQFEDALVSLDAVDPNTIDGWTTLRAAILRISIYGILNRKEEAEKAIEDLKPLLADLFLQEVSGLLARSMLPFKDEKSAQLLIDGLEKAGSPELPFGYDASSEYFLTGSETKTLLFGHEIKGRQMSSYLSYWRSTRSDGATVIRLGSVEDTGTVRIEGDAACIFYTRWGRICFAYFRNPKGSTQGGDEYIAVQPWDQFEFAVVR